MIGRWLATVACVACLTGAVLAATQVVTLKDGRTFTGEVTKIATGYRIEMVGGAIEVTNDQVKSVEAASSAADEYAARLKKIDPNSADDHYQLGAWAYGRKLTEAAKTELQAALRLDPRHQRAAMLLKEMTGGGEVVKPPETQPVGPLPPVAPVEGNMVGPSVRDEWLVPEGDIYKVRMEEIRSGEVLNVRLLNNVVDRFVTASEGQGDFRSKAFGDKFRVWTNAQKAVYIREKVTSDDYKTRDDIQFTEDPKVLATFRRRVWPIVAGHCGTVQCHGGGEARGGMRLFVTGGSTDRLDYTNFVVLDGMVGKEGRVVDRDAPGDSLLLNFMLPEDLAQFKHPTKIKPLAPTRKDQNYILIREWVSSLRPAPHPNYRLAYKPPFGMRIVSGPTPLEGTSQPATAPDAPKPNP